MLRTVLTSSFDKIVGMDDREAPWLSTERLRAFQLSFGEDEVSTAQGVDMCEYWLRQRHAVKGSSRTLIWMTGQGVCRWC